MEGQNFYQNITEKQWKTLISIKFVFVPLTNLASLMFMAINCIMMYTLCSRPVFRETPRYILLLNLVVADSIVMFMGHLLYILSSFNEHVSYPLCGVLIMIPNLSSQISPLTLSAMSVERYIAVCFPFRHSIIVTMRNTVFVILCIWGLGCVDILFQVLLLLEFPFHLLPSLQMNSYCIYTAWAIGPRSQVYSMASTIVRFMFSALVIVLSFIGVTVVALSATTDKESAKKARNTLLLHMFQLSMNLMSTMERVIFNGVATLKDLILAGKLFVVVYIFMVMMPRCLSSLTYGLKDPSIRPVLVSHLCCHLQVPPNTVTAHKHFLQK